RPGLLVHELAFDLDRALARRLDLAFLHEALIGHAIAFADIEAEPDRIERDDSGEQRGSGGAAGAAHDEVADAHLVPADAARDRRRHARVIEVELRLVDGGDGRVARSRGDIHLGEPLVIGFLRGVVVFAQLRRALELGLGELELGFGLRLLRLGGFERELERAWLDDEQEIALLHQLAVGKIDGFEIAAHPRAHLDRFARLELAGEVAPFLHLLHERLGDGHLRWRRRIAGALLALPETPIVIEKRRGTRHDEKQEHAPQPSSRAAGASFGRGRRLGLAGGRLWSFQVRRRLLVIARRRIVGAVVAASVSLLHRGRINLDARTAPYRAAAGYN